ncbi:MAG: aminotransferase class V-fold PLP-dependent enzyme [Nitrospirae bacterium]|nr:aminotransferase class V-fold PLP-dependent enzyme [Nitrospirota bacterium]
MKNLFGGYPGARYIGTEELSGVTDIVNSRSPYRFYGLDLLKRTEELEALCSKRFMRGYALAVSSGTAALHTALYSAGVRSGDEVILPGYAWSADLMAILALSAVPVIAPIDKTLGLDADALVDCITKKTKAIIAVHMRGVPCDIIQIINIAKKHGVKVIEDGAQCIGGLISGEPVGGVGDISVLSFQFNKLITSGEGGVVLTNDAEIYERARAFHDLGMLRMAGNADPEGLEGIKSLGLNYRLSELQSAFLIPQIDKIDMVLAGLRGNFRLAVESLRPIMDEFGLSIRDMIRDTSPNHAFLGLTAESKGSFDAACMKMKDLGLPIQLAGRIDGHHFRTWAAFMDREGWEYRLHKPEQSEEFLNRMMFLEIKSRG